MAEGTRIEPDSAEETRQAIEAEKQAAAGRMDNAFRLLHGADAPDELKPGNMLGTTGHAPGKKPGAAAGPPRDPDTGRFAARSEEADEAEADEADVEAADEEGRSEGTADEVEATGDDEDPDYDRAVQALRYEFGEDASRLLDKLDREELVDLGLRARKNQRKRDRALQDRAEPEDHDDAADEDEHEEPVYELPDSVRERAQRWAEGLGADEDAQREFVALFHEVMQAETERIGEGFQGLLDSTQAQSAAIAEMIERNTRSRLSAELPTVQKDDNLWDRIHEKAVRLIRSGYEDLDEAFDDAADLVTDGGLREKRRERSRTRSKRRTNGTPRTPARREMTPRDREKDADERGIALLRRLTEG